MGLLGGSKVHSAPGRNRNWLAAPHPMNRRLQRGLRRRPIVGLRSFSRRLK